MSANTLLAISTLQAALRASQELSAIIQKAQMENRDVTDEEIKALKLGNDLLSEDLIKRLQA